MSQREPTKMHLPDAEPIDSGEHADIPRRLRLSSREIGVAVALTLAALLQIYWSMTRDGEKLTSAGPHLAPAGVIQHAR